MHGDSSATPSTAGLSAWPPRSSWALNVTLSRCVSVLTRRCELLQQGDCGMEERLLCRRCGSSAPLLRLRPSPFPRPSTARPRARACRPAAQQRRRHVTVCQAAAAISLDGEDDPRAYLEGASKQRPPKLPAPPTGTSLWAVLPYLCQLATADR